MKFSLPNAFLLFALIFLPKALLSQNCGSGTCPPGQPMWSQDPTAGCIAINEFELDCASGVMPQGGVVVQPPTWCTTVENNIFYQFTASGSSVAFDVAAFNCQGGNGALQAAILDCAFNFMSTCWGNIPGGTSQVVINDLSPLTPGETYLLMIDGSAGAICDYIINGAIPSAPIGPGICVGGPSGNNIGTYTSNLPGTWTIIPPTAGNILPPSTGTTSATIEWVQSGMFQVCVSACPNGMASCLNVDIGENIEIFEGPIQVCMGDSYLCGQYFI